MQASKQDADYGVRAVVVVGKEEASEAIYQRLGVAPHIDTENQPLNTGNLILVFRSRATGSIDWRGVIQVVIKEEASDAERMARIDRTVKQLISTLPTPTR